MNEQELKRRCANATRQELVNLLSSVEKNYNIVYPFLERYTTLYLKLENAEKSVEEHKDNAKNGFIASAICAVFTLVFYVWSANARNLGALLLRFLAIGAVVTVIPNLYRALNSRKAAKRCEKEIEELKTAVAQAKMEMDQRKEQYKIDMLVRQWICPKECIYPRYLRSFISYFEDGRADSLKEAYALFDEMLHREKMEGLAQEQVRHAQAAESAAYAALNAANQAAADASRAKNSADWAAFNTRFKD